MKGAEAVVRLLEQAGVEVIFGLCGDTSLPLYEALAQSSAVRHLLTRDERSASYMADCYARLSGRLGVCEGPSGGGVLYLAPGLAEANLSSVPLLGITTDIDWRLRDRGTLTELDQDAFYRPITTWTRTPAHGEELCWAVREAVKRATAGPLGAVHLGLPYNVQEAEVAADAVYLDPRTGAYPVNRPHPDPAEVRKAARLLREARRPVVVAGAGVLRAAAWEELRALTELLGAPVATSISGKGALAETHPLCLGVVGSNGGLAHRHAVLKAADLILYLGCRAGSVTTEKWTLPQNHTAQVVQMDLSPATLGLNYQLAAEILADAKPGIAALTEELARLSGGRPLAKGDPAALARAREEFLAGRPEFASDEAPIQPERLVAELSAALPEDAVIVCDPGTPTPYLAAYHRLPRAGRWFVAPRAHGALGYSLPAVVGAALARPGSRVVGLMGDGSFAMSAGELETIARLGLPLTLIVMRNASFGWVKAGQKTRGRGYFGVDFAPSDHVAIARAYGLAASRVEDPRGLAAGLRAALASPGPHLLEVVTRPLQETRAPVSKWVA